MCMYIGIENLAASALIKLLAWDSKNKFVKFSDLIDYGTEVVKILNAKREEAVLVYSRESSELLFSDYSEFFKLDTVDGWEGVRLQDGKTVKDLWAKFLSSASVKLMAALDDEKAIQALRKAA